ncbi:hypothetical protein BDR04DRAFT_56429 [Suillus decipiens]|nr:hypothetical protein BDR04DRAFT_56429 [Suillus decipiens]
MTTCKENEIAPPHLLCVFVVVILPLSTISRILFGSFEFLGSKPTLHRQTK